MSANRRIAVVVALAAVAFAAVAFAYSENEWRVTGRGTELQVTAAASEQGGPCTFLDGTHEDQQQLWFTSDLPATALSAGVRWTVHGHHNAERVARCLRDNGLVDVEVRWTGWG